MMKKSVMNCIPCLRMKLPTVPYLPQRICAGSVCEPQVKKCVPIMKKQKSISELLSCQQPNLRKVLQIRIESLHPARRLLQLRKTEPAIQLMRVFGGQHPAPKSLQLLMRDDHFDQPFAKTSSSVFINNKHIGEPRKSCVVGDNAGESDLFPVFVNAEVQRVPDRSLYNLKAAAPGPICTV